MAALKEGLERDADDAECEGKRPVLRERRGDRYLRGAEQGPLKESSGWAGIEPRQPSVGLVDHYDQRKIGHPNLLHHDPARGY